MQRKPIKKINISLMLLNHDLIVLASEMILRNQKSHTLAKMPFDRKYLNYTDVVCFNKL